MRLLSFIIMISFKKNRINKYPSCGLTVSEKGNYIMLILKRHLAFVMHAYFLISKELQKPFS